MNRAYCFPQIVNVLYPQIVNVLYRWTIPLIVAHWNFCETNFLLKVLCPFFETSLVDGCWQMRPSCKPGKNLHYEKCTKCNVKQMLNNVRGWRYCYIQGGKRAVFWEKINPPHHFLFFYEPPLIIVMKLYLTRLQQRNKHAPCCCALSTVFRTRWDSI